MDIGHFESLKSNYEEGAFKISLRSSRPTIIKEDLNLILKPFPYNYDLFFNRKGTLLHSIHFDKSDKYKIIYGYDNDNRLVCSFELSSIHNVLNEINEFSYDADGRILLESCRELNLDPNYDYTTEYIHTYTDNKEITHITTNCEEDDEHTVFDTYDEKKRLIETKAFRNGEEFIYCERYEYNEQNILIRSISINEEGYPDGVSEYPPPISKDMECAFKYSSTGVSFLKEYAYSYNEKGHWINQVVLKDGMPNHIIDRTIEYY